MVLTGTSQSREELSELGGWLSSGKGIVTLYHLIVGDVDELSERGLRETSRKHRKNTYKIRDWLRLPKAAW